jgi:WD40 repeat protein
MRVLTVAKCKRVAHLSFAPDRGRIAAVTSGAEGHVGSVVWVDVATGEPGRTIPLDTTCCAIAPEHDKLAIGYSPYSRPGGASEVRWSDLRVGKGNGSWNDVRELPHHHIFALTFTPDGTRLAIGCSGQKTFNHPWEHAIHVTPIGGGLAATIPVEAAAGELKFSPDGRWLVVTGGPGGDPRIRFRDVAAGEWRGEHTPKVTRTRRIVFAPGRPEFVALAAKKAILLAAGRSEPLAVLEGHTAGVADAAYTPDGRRIITVGGDSTARVWDARTGAKLGTFAWPVGKLSAVAVAPDGLTAAAGGEKGQIVVWDVDE